MPKRFNATAVGYILLFSFSLCTVAYGQNPSGNGPSLDTSPASVANAITVFSGGKSIQNIQLTGTVKTHFGMDDSGPAILTANANGVSTVEYRLGEGTRKESAGTKEFTKSCSWSGPDGVSHSAAVHNCLRGVVWFLPGYSLQLAMTSKKDNFASAGMQPNSTVETVKHSRNLNSGKAENDARFQQLSETEVDIDSQSGLITAIRYKIHPDKDLAINMPVEVRYSDYRQVNGVKLAFAIQKFINGNLVEEVTVETVTAN